MSSLTELRSRLADLLKSRAPELQVAGAVVGVAVGDEDIAVAYGAANLNTGQGFTPDTGFLLGSVTKVLTATALMRLVERRAFDLDGRVVDYLPEFTLRDPAAAGDITVRMLLNHSNGIDADSLVPTAVRGRDASAFYVEHLADRGVLFDPGTFLHYSNPGFVLAARLLEVGTGVPFERAIEQELLGPCGMPDATALQTQAFLRRTAVGAFADPQTGELRATELFTLGEPLAGGGSTLIVTVADLLSFGRMHLAGGLGGQGARVLSAESVQAMQTPTLDIGLPQAPPIGLGWWMPPVADTVALWHSGGSPNGQSSFCLLPEHETVVAVFATGPGRFPMLDLIHTAVIEHVVGRPATMPVEWAPRPVDPTVAGEYRSFQSRVVVEHDDDLVFTEHFEPYDEEHRQQLTAFDPTTAGPRTTRYTSVAEQRYAPVGVEAASLGGVFGRMSMVSALPAVAGRPAGLHGRLRFTPKVSD